MKDAQKNAIITVDVDSWQTQLAFYGYPNEPYDNDVYENSLPRLADLLEKFGIKATFFIVGTHVKEKKNRELLRKLAERGCELANHTMTHPQGFSKLDDKKKEKEIADCGAILEDLTGKKIKGFRAPDYDIDERTVDILAKNGYLYDASVFPTFLAIPMKLTRFILSGMKRMHTMGGLCIPLSPSLPYRPDSRSLWKKGNAGIVELPLSVSGFFRLPLYGTAAMAFGRKYLDGAFWMVRRKPFVNYTIHAFEMADKDRDSIDKRLFRHPGVKRPFAEKYSFCESALKKISENFRVITAEKYVEGIKI